MRRVVTGRPCGMKIWITSRCGPVATPIEISQKGEHYRLPIPVQWVRVPNLLWRTEHIKNGICTFPARRRHNRDSVNGWCYISKAFLGAFVLFMRVAYVCSLYTTFMSSRHFHRLCVWIIMPLLRSTTLCKCSENLKEKINEVLSFLFVS